MDAASVSRAVRNNREVIGLSDFRPHDLRRTAASILARLGTRNVVIKKILNHKDYSVTATYNRYMYLEEKRDAMIRLDELVTNLIGGSGFLDAVLVCTYHEVGGYLVRNFSVKKESCPDAIPVPTCDILEGSIGL